MSELSDFSDSLVVIPTFNEASNIPNLAEAVFSACPGISVLIIDDNSQDGTAKITQNLKARYPNLFFVSRTGKRSLAHAYLYGFKLALEKPQITKIIQMDADLSHKAMEIPKLLEKLTSYDLAIGSRYVFGANTKIWNPVRLSLSRIANFYSRKILGAPIRDLTSGFCAWRRPLLEKLLARPFKSSGFAFQIEIKARAVAAGARLVEVPISFENRHTGRSKLSLKIVAETAWIPWSLLFQ